MGAYYYLAAQLPYLVYGQDPPMSSSSFKALAWDQMSPSEAALLDSCTLDPDPTPVVHQDGEQAEPEIAYAEPASRTSSGFLNLWREWERTLRLNLVKSRALKLRREAPVEAPELPSDAVAAAKAALAMDSPLEAELSLDKARWDAIQNLQGMDIFSEGAIYAYLLKLLLMERRTAFNTEEGFTEYKALYTAILGEAK